ncbi:predicted protein [Postia placenta Mad-698-R]|nr:predicted protein [Postia placenta Mad-698-R]
MSPPLGSPYKTLNDSIRQDSVQLAGVLVILAIVLAGGIWLCIHFYTERPTAQRDRLNADSIPSEATQVPSMNPSTYVDHSVRARSETRAQRNMSRARLPDRAPATRGAIRVPAAVNGHPTTEDAVSCVPAPSPTTSLRPVFESIPRPQSVSFARPITGSTSFSGPRTSHRHGAYRTSTYSIASSASALDEVHMRTVRQEFCPTLPDELALTASERVAVVRTCADGWCIVGRDSHGRPGDIELGAAPLWAFAAPAEGVVPVRPQRTSSLGIHVTLDTPGGLCFSWTNATS